MTFKDIPGYLWLMLLTLMLVAAFISSGKDSTIQGLMVQSFAATLAVFTSDRVNNKQDKPPTLPAS